MAPDNNFTQGQAQSPPRSGAGQVPGQQTIGAIQPASMPVDPAQLAAMMAKQGQTQGQPQKPGQPLPPGGAPAAGGPPMPSRPTAPAGQAPSGMPAGMPGGMPGGAPGGAPKPPASMFDPSHALRDGILPEDLPFANEVEAALARKPKAAARLLSLAVFLFFVILTIWASQAEIDEVTHAEGQVVASQRIQAIQNLEGGILRELLVKEGQIVEPGDLLARLDNEVAESSYRDAVYKSLEHLAAIARLEAELGGKQPVFPTYLVGWINESMGVKINSEVSQTQANQIFSDQLASYRARTQQRQAELNLLKTQFNQRMLEVEEQAARKRQLDQSLALVSEQRNIAYPLMQRGSYSRVDYLNLQNQVVSLQGEIETLAASIPRVQASAQEAEQRMLFRNAELDATITEEIGKRRAELATLRETLSAGGDRVTRTELRAPVRGSVRQIFISTVGGVVKPGESIMDIVPLDDTLLIEARVRPADVAFLRQGQSAMVKISAFDFSIFGGLEGRLEQISADTIEDRRGEFFYHVQVRTEKNEIVYRGESRPIAPGMMATVDIMIGKKTVLDYILKPIMKAQQNAFRER